MIDPDYQEKILYTSRIHPKILFKTALIQLGLLLLLTLILKYIPLDADGVPDIGKWSRIILFLGFFIAETVLVLIPFLKWWNEIFTVTERRVKNEWGVLSKGSREIDLNRIVSISEERGILDRIFGCGTLNLYDAAAGQQPTTNPLTSHDNHGGIRFHDVPEVKKVKSIIEQARQQQK